MDPFILEILNTKDNQESFQKLNQFLTNTFKATNSVPWDGSRGPRRLC
jgi:hypothetical protein